MRTAAQQPEWREGSGLSRVIPIFSRVLHAIRRAAPAPPTVAPPDLALCHPVPKTGGWAARLRPVLRDECQLQWLAFAFMLVVYGLLLAASWKLVSGDPLDLTFNSMLEHLMHGRFDVDPRIVGSEGFARDGHVYAYWGIWCALLRLPLWIVHRMNVDITAWSCLAAVCAAGMAKVRAVLLLRRHGAETPTAKWAVGLMLAYVLLGGSQVGYLRASVYQEVIFWSYAFAEMFVYFAIKGLVNRWFNLGLLSRMALCAGLALLTRASTGIGLLIAMTALLLMLAVHSRTEAEGHRSPVWGLGPALTQHRVLVPLGILAALIAVTGMLNYFRWHNPVIFANYDFYLADLRFPHWLPLMHMYGSFNLRRIPFGLVYYFAPVWVLHRRSGQLLFAGTQAQLFARVEVPPGSFFLTDLLPICFVVLLAAALWRRRGTNLRHVRQWAAGISVGLLVPCLLMLSYISATYRYRMDFYPALDFLAFLGLYATLTDSAILGIFATFRNWIAAALLVSIASSFAEVSLYDLALAPSGRAHAYYHGAVQFLYLFFGRLSLFHA